MDEKEYPELDLPTQKGSPGKTALLTKASAEDRISVETSFDSNNRQWITSIETNEFYTTQELMQARRRLYYPEDIEIGDLSKIRDEELKPLQAVMNWMTSFIMRAHQNQGRSGAVCPFVKPSIRERVLTMTVCHLEDPSDANEIWRKMMMYQDIFLTQEPLSGEFYKLKCIVIVLPDISDQLADEIMEPLHKKLKSHLLEQKLLIGQFYPTCKVSGTYNAQFFPLQSPVPMFAIRPLIETDIRFLHGNSEWETIYHQYFSSDKSASQLN